MHKFLASILLICLLIIGITTFCYTQEPYTLPGPYRENRTGIYPGEAAEQITFTALYPSPYGVYKTITLFPSDVVIGGECPSQGEMAYSSANNTPVYCNGSNWTVIGSGAVPGGEDSGFVYLEGWEPNQALTGKGLLGCFAGLSYWPLSAPANPVIAGRYLGARILPTMINPNLDLNTYPPYCAPEDWDEGSYDDGTLQSHAAFAQ